MCVFLLTVRTFVCGTLVVTGAEFIRKIRKLAKDNSMEFRHDKDLGKGSHTALYLGESGFTIIKDLKKELGPGAVSAMCKQLGIAKADIQ
jgi:predicted RNA binding protein YcfA (HicA-like mRNA interferase family)